MTQHPPHTTGPPPPDIGAESPEPDTASASQLPAGPGPLGRARALEADIHRRLRTLAHATQPPAEHVLEACHGGLDPAQTIRAVAALTVGWPESELRCGGFWESLTTCEAYIRDGTRPEPEPQPEQQPVCTCTPWPGRPNVLDGTGCARHNPALREEGRP